MTFIIRVMRKLIKKRAKRRKINLNKVVKNLIGLSISSIVQLYIFYVSSVDVDTEAGELPPEESTVKTKAQKQAEKKERERKKKEQQRLQKQKKEGKVKEDEPG